MTDDLMVQDLRRLNELCELVANGGSPIELASAWGMNYGELMTWVNDDKYRYDRFQKSLRNRGEWAIERVLKEMRSIALSNIQEVLNPDGTVKPLDQWSEENGRAIQSLEVDEIWAGKGPDRVQIGITKKIKFLDKTKALELLGKNLALFVERVAISTTSSLEEMVMKTIGGSSDLQPVKEIEAPKETSQEIKPGTTKKSVGSETA